MDEIAIAALVRDGSVLLAHRQPARRWYPDCWDLVGGHVERGESPQDAVLRECREEVAVDVSQLRPVKVRIDDPNLRAHAFLVTGWTGEPTNAAPEEHDALSWFSSDQIAGLRLAHPSYPSWLPRLIAGSTAVP
ncbi:MAG TPA: NUDIX domain-containing protein [Segeticoccus sp.]|nr:NUDIX domain-containing protein [Segeticoccus sp.]